METGHAVVGFDAQTLNDIIGQFFKCLHPTGILNVPPCKVRGTTTTVSISIDEAPSVDLVDVSDPGIPAIALVLNRCRAQLSNLTQSD